MNNNNILNNGFIIKEEFYDITKEIPVLSNANIIYNEIKKILNLYLDNYKNLKYSFDSKFNNFNDTFNTLNKNIIDLNQKLLTEKEKNNALIDKSNNKIYEYNRLMIDSNENNKNASLELESIKQSITNLYNNILDNYNEVFSKINLKGNINNKNKTNRNIIKKSFNNTEREHEIKEIILELEKIFNDIIEYVSFCGEDKNKINNLEKESAQLKKEKMELVKQINKIKNEINSVIIENNNKRKKLKIMKQ